MFRAAGKAKVKVIWAFGNHLDSLLGGSARNIKEIMQQAAVSSLIRAYSNRLKINWLQ